MLRKLVVAETTTLGSHNADALPNFPAFICMDFGNLRSSKARLYKRPLQPVYDKV